MGSDNMAMGHFFFQATLYFPAQLGGGYTLSDLLDKRWLQVPSLLPSPGTYVPSLSSRREFNIYFHWSSIDIKFCMDRENEIANRETMVMMMSACSLPHVVKTGRKPNNCRWYTNQRRLKRLVSFTGFYIHPGANSSSIR